MKLLLADIRYRLIDAFSSLYPMRLRHAYPRLWKWYFDLWMRAWHKRASAYIQSLDS